MGEIKIYNGSSWSTVPSAGVKVYDGGWQLVKKAYRWNGNTWVDFYSGSDQQTYTFVASYSRSARGLTWATSGNPGGPTYPRQGRYGTAYPWFGLFTFGNDTSGVSLTSRLSVRPVVKSASISLFRWSEAHGYWPSGWGDVYIGKYNDSIYATSPHPGNTNFTYYAYQSFPYGGNTLELGEQAAINLASQGLTHAQQLVDHAKNYPLCVANTNDNSSASGGLQHYGTSNDTDYFIYFPYDAYYITAPIGPVLTVTLDYS